MVDLGLAVGELLPTSLTLEEAPALSAALCPTVANSRI
jgi:hypothetical protein